MSFKKRFIALFLVLALMAAGTVIYINISGDTFTDVIVNNTFEYDERNIHTELDKEGVLEIENAYLSEDGHPCLELHSLSECSCTVRKQATENKR